MPKIGLYTEYVFGLKCSDTPVITSVVPSLIDVLFKQQFSEINFFIIYLLEEGETNV